MEQFLEKVKDGPDFVCCVCYRLLFRHQVVQCRREFYKGKKEKTAVADRCISEEYLHKCSEGCVSPCLWLDSARGQLWICTTCHQKLSRGQMPAECAVNKLVPDPIPHELACLNSLEQHLIALHIPFMKMLALPKGGQNGVHGPVTCVPANIVQTNNLLPRSNMEGSLLPVKLKRKLTYKGHYRYQFVDTMRIRQALHYLKHHNSYYRDIEFNEEWLNAFCKEESSVDVVDGTGVEGELEDELLHDRQQHCMFQDTCLMPVDIGQETLDQYLDTILNVAPAEGNNPVSLLTDRANEAKCFPVLFPQGLNTYHESRVYQLSLSRYFNNRILNADGRFAQNVEYIFYAQYLSELEQVVSKVSIALRKGGSNSQTVPQDLLNNDEALKELFQRDDGYRFLTPIRGTPPFWQGVQRDLFACVRQLGIPTWFCSFSSADLRWKNLLTSILIQEGRTETAEQLEWADRCDLLRRNPVTAARMFDFRWHCFLREVLMSPSQPIGKIVDSFYRVEFQQRGSPHVHCLFWIENAPIIDKNSDAEVIDFIDRYVTCQLPSEDQGLLDTVTSVQQHSKRHSKSCKKGGNTCRFNFPRPPSCRTFISRLQVCTCTDLEKGCKCRMDKRVAQGVLLKVKEALADEKRSFVNLEELFGSLSITQSVYEESYRRLARKTEVVLERQVGEAWINQYSKPLLKCWDANIDCQFVTDAHAVVVYIISYISKGETEGGLMLQNAQKEASKEQNLSAREAMKRLGSVYLHNRDVSAQEAVYRLVQGLHLKECSRKVVFVPTGDNIVRMSLPVSVLRERAGTEGVSADNMWMTSLVDRYRNRPESRVFNDMCMATFASEYRVLSKNETCKNSIALRNNCGFIVKRSRTEPAVVRYARFSQTKTPELYYQSVLQLFLPYRVDDQLKPPGWETFEQFYRHGSVGLSDESTHTVNSVVDNNRSRFEIEAQDLEEIRNNVDSDTVENAWAQLCPEQEVERLECREEGKVDEGQLLSEPAEHIPDLAVTEQQVAHIERTNNTSRSDGLALIRSLNETQLSIFYQIRQWCLDKVAGKKPDPFHVFITGGAGTGKSHLIRAIQYEATRLLAVTCHSPDNVSILLTAPTGIAAYNLNAATIHNTLCIGKNIRLPYTPLGEERLNVLRARLMDLHILIIDEISMVDHKMLVYIHGRLWQIKQSGDFSPFWECECDCCRGLLPVASC